MERGQPESQSDDPWFAMATSMLGRFSPGGMDRAALLSAYQSHNAAVRRVVPADRLIEWEPGQGWGPICDGLGLKEPDESFPHVNTTDDFRNMAGLSLDS
jgi:hypothetical protein